MFFFYIPFSYAKILGETKFYPQDFPRSGSKAVSIERRRKKEERKTVITIVSTQNTSPTLPGLPSKWVDICEWRK